jgi:hypothetical protein
MRKNFLCYYVGNPCRNRIFMLEFPTHFPFFMLEFYVGLKNTYISVCWKSMSELHFYVGIFDILFNFYVGNSDTPTFSAKNH